MEREVRQIKAEEMQPDNNYILIGFDGDFYYLFSVGDDEWIKVQMPPMEMEEADAKAA